MAVSLPTAADVRKVREQAAKSAAERAEVARTPLLAVLGAGDAAVTAVTKAVTEARARSKAQAEEVQARVSALPQKLTAEEARKAAADVRAQAESAYAGFAKRGEKAWGKIRTRPQVQQAIARIESYTEVLDARVDGFVDDAHDAAEKALAVVTRQTRSTGEKAAQTTQKVAEEAAEKLTDVSSDVAERLTEAGDEAAHETRSVTRRAANRTAPKTAPKVTPRSTQPKPATRRTTNGTSGS
jgi:heparin binding hemagglutinin HbhA